MGVFPVSIPWVSTGFSPQLSGFFPDLRGSSPDDLLKVTPEFDPNAVGFVGLIALAGYACGSEHEAMKQGMMAIEEMS